MGTQNVIKWDKI